MDPNILHRIDAKYSKLSKAHRKLANAVAYNYDKIAYMTAAKFGRMVNVSESTVIRFVYALGYEKYSDFQHALFELMRRKLTPKQRIELAKQSLGKRDIVDYIMSADIHKIRHSLEKLDRNTFFKAVDIILNAKTLYITGARSSEALARMFEYNMSLIFDNVKFLNPSSSVEVFEQMYSIGSDDALFAVSFPRYSTKIIDAVRFARSKGAKNIVITDGVSSPYAENADCLLTAQTDMASYMDSLVAPMSIINAIVIEITRRRENEITERFENLEKIWDEYNVYSKK